MEIIRFFNYLSKPGVFDSGLIFGLSIAVMAVVFVVDLMTPDYRLHMLYIFPLAAITLHSNRDSTAVAGLFLSTTFQISTFIIQNSPADVLAVDTIVAVTSAILTIFLARAARENYLSALSLATTDWLTGLHNRRNFQSIADLEIEKQKRYGGTFSLAVIDLDDFKYLNDSKGHHIGDQALRLLADVLIAHTRKSDSVARLGGDEFAILMPKTSGPECGYLCSELALKIQSSMAESGYQITASIGYATFDLPPESTTHALQKADEGMYAAKAQGKNCAVSTESIVFHANSPAVSGGI